MIVKVDLLPEHTSDLGIQPQTLENLRSIVIFAGPNGGGKSRYLRAVSTAVEIAMRHVESLRQLREQVTQLRAELSKPNSDVTTAARIETCETAIGEARKRLASVRSTDGRFVLPILLRPVNIAAEVPRPKHAIPMQATGAMGAAGLSTGQGVRFNESSGEVTSHAALASLGIENLYSTSWQYVAGVSRDLWLARHPDHQAIEASLRAKERAEKFNAMLQTLLGTRIEVKIEEGYPVPLLFGRPFHPPELSPGQRVLLAWCIALHERSTRDDIRGGIVMLDEPELHLHPAAVSDLVRRLLSDILGAEGQVWLATHSPAVLACFYDEASLFEVRDSYLQKADRHVDRVLEGLMGGADGRRAIRRLAHDAELAEFHRFAAECLWGPTVSARTGDTQGVQFLSLTERLGKRLGVSPVRSLDYGSGRGRFAMELASAQEERRTLVDYRTWDDPAHNHDEQERRHAMATLYPEEGVATSRVSTRISDFQHERLVHLVVMCNFLHEIPPDDWLHHLRQAESVLAPGGVLAVMEDQQLSHGELPHPAGFVVMNVDEIRTLLGSSDTVIAGAYRRCSVIEITKEGLRRATTDRDHDSRLRSALEQLVHRAETEIKAIRAKHSFDERDALHHARSVMQMANATLALRTRKSG